MTLKKWMEQNKLSCADLAKVLKVSKTTIFKYANKTRVPSLAMAVKIEGITLGKVTCRDLL